MRSVHRTSRGTNVAVCIVYLQLVSRNISGTYPGSTVPGAGLMQRQIRACLKDPRSTDDWIGGSLIQRKPEGNAEPGCRCRWSEPCTPWLRRPARQLCMWGVPRADVYKLLYQVRYTLSYPCRGLPVSHFYISTSEGGHQTPEMEETSEDYLVQTPTPEKLTAHIAWLFGIK